MAIKKKFWGGDRVSLLCSSGVPESHYIDQADQRSPWLCLPSAGITVYTTRLSLMAFLMVMLGSTLPLSHFPSSKSSILKQASLQRECLCITQRQKEKQLNLESRGRKITASSRSGCILHTW